MGNKKENNFIGFINGVIEVIGDGYIDSNNKKRYKCKCNRCGREYFQTKSNIQKMKGLGCVKCCNTTHKMKNTAIYNVWKNMKFRCSALADVEHRKHYYDKGIRVCDKWKKDFVCFYNWAIKNGYSEDLYKSGRNKLTIDRIDNSKGYSPENCRILTHQDQQWNKDNNSKIEFNGNLYNLKELSNILNLPISTIKSRNRRGSKIDNDYVFKDFSKLEYDGQYYSFGELSKKFNIPRRILYSRIKIYGWNIDKSLRTTICKMKSNIKLYDYKGQKLCISEISKIVGINRTTLQYRLSNGWSIEDAVNKEVRK